MRRLFWLAMGITVGVLVMRKITQTLEKLTPQGMAGGIAAGLRDIADAIGGFSADVRSAMADREHELRVTTGLDGTTGAAPAERRARHAEGE